MNRLYADRSGSAHQRGFSLIEVMVTIVLLTLGLLGVFGLQGRAANVELESYQRSQAMTLAREMEASIRAARTEFTTAGALALSSEDGTVFVGTDGTVECDPPAGTAAESLCAWGDALAGDLEVDDNTGTAVGAMIGARGCLIRPVAPEGAALADLYVVVVWRGITEGSALPDGALPALCASDADDIPANLRRGVALRVLVPQLQSTLP